MAAIQPVLQLTEYDARRWGVNESSADNLVNLNTAIAAVGTAGGGVLKLPPGTFLVGPSGTATYVTLKNKVILRGSGPATVLKVKDAAGAFEQMIGDNSINISCGIEDLSIDMNPSGNTVDAAAVTGQRQFCIDLSSSEGAWVRNVRFDPYCGVWAILAGSSTSEINDVRVTDNYFRFLPRTAPAAFDNTAIYLENCNHTITGNHFEALIASGARSAIELHGSGGNCTGNVTDGYQVGCHVVGPAGTPDPHYSGHNVTGNTFRNVGSAGVLIWPLTGKVMRGVVVNSNTITFKQIDHDAVFTSDSYVGIGLTWAALASGNLEGLTVNGNTITFQDEGAGRVVTNEFLRCGINLAGFGVTTTGAVVTGNTIIRAPAIGIRCGGIGAGTHVKASRVAGNVIIDAGQNALIATDLLRNAIAFQYDMTGVVIEGNSIHDTGTSGLKGVYAIAGLGGGTYTGVVIRNNPQFCGQATLLTYANTVVSGISVGDRGVTTNRGDVDVTLVWGQDKPIQRFASPLTANRTVTLSSTGAGEGALFRIVRTGLGAFTMDVGGLKTIPSATAAFVDVGHDGTQWRLAGYGTL